MKRILLIFAAFGVASCYAQDANSPCLNVPVSLTGDGTEVTVGANTPSMNTDKVYVYYHRKGHRKLDLGPEFADVPDPRASKPILLSKTKDVSAMAPQAYSVTLNTPDDRVKACADSTLSLQANISVQQEGEYTGNYPATVNKNYKLVSKRTYRRTERKMRNAERKETRVARLTGVEVTSSTSM